MIHENNVRACVCACVRVCGVRVYATPSVRVYLRVCVCTCVRECVRARVHLYVRAYVRSCMSALVRF